MRVTHLVFASALVFVTACSEGTSSFPAAPEGGVKTDTSVTTDTSVKVDSAAVQDTAKSDTTSGDSATGPITLKALQDPSDAAHPTPGARVTLSDTDLVTLSPRMLLGSSTGTQCRFAVWIGKSGGGAFAGVQVQELLDRGTASNCFAVTPGKIGSTIVPGQPVSAIEGTYAEFCAGPTGTPATMCRSFEQTQIFLGGTATFTLSGGGGATPTPTSVAVADLVKDAAGAEGPRALDLEGTLVRVTNVKVLQELSGTFKATLVVAAGDTTSSKKLEIQISNFINTNCVRTYFADQEGLSVSSITGILVPDFGRWKIRLRDEKDVSGVICATDAGTSG
jgi:hypothetical protein